MSKVCKKCGHINDESTQFCIKCGSNVFDFTNYQNYSSPQFKQAPFQNPQTKKKGIKPWVIVLIVVGIMLLLGAIAFFGYKFVSEDAGKTHKSNSKRTSMEIEETSSVEETTPIEETKVARDNVPYTKGKIENGYYVNEWAGLKFSVSDFPSKGSNDLESNKGERVDIGYYYLDITKVRTLTITFEDLSGLDFTANDCIEGLLILQKKELDSQGVQYTVSNVFEKTIAGEKYQVVKIDINGEYCSYTCSRMIGDRSVNINIAESTEKDVLDSLKLIRSY